MRHSLYIVVILAIIVDLASAETYVDSKAEFKVPIGQERQDDMTNMIKATVGQEFVITLDANATTGYEWQLANTVDDSLINLMRSEYAPDKTGLVGSGGKSIWTFKAVRAGKTQISFKYIRPWEKNTPPARKTAYIIDIQDEELTR